MSDAQGKAEINVKWFEHALHLRDICNSDQMSDLEILQRIAWYLETIVNLGDHQE